MNDRALPGRIFKANLLLIYLIFHVLLIVICICLSTLIVTTLILRLIVYCRAKQAEISLIQTVSHSIDVKHLVSCLVSYAYFVRSNAADDAVIRIPLLFFTRVL